MKNLISIIVMEIIFYILVGLGLLVIFGKAILGLFAALGGIIAIIVPIAIICAIIYLLSFLF